MAAAAAQREMAMGVKVVVWWSLGGEQWLDRQPWNKIIMFKCFGNFKGEITLLQKMRGVLNPSPSN